MLKVLIIPIVAIITIKLTVGLDISSSGSNEAIQMLSMVKNRIIEYDKTTSDKPFITIAYAQTIDGSIAPIVKERLNISSITSFKLLHSIRKYHDAVLVGINTIVSDNPRLNVREVLAGENIPTNQPRSIILDSNLKILNLSNLQLQKPIVITCIKPDDKRFIEAEKILKQMNGSIICCKCDENNRCDFIDAMKLLYKLNIKSILIEGGAEIIQSALESNICHQLLVTIRPCYLGGYRSITKELKSLAQLYDIFLTTIGGDIVIFGKLFNNDICNINDNKCDNYNIDNDGFLRSKVNIVLPDT